MDPGGPCRPKRKHPLPRFGDRFEELTVTGFELGSRGGVRRVLVQCSCDAPEHFVLYPNLNKGKSTRCDACARAKGQRSLKVYRRYASICPDDKHRRRLLNRIASCLNRCGNPKAAEYANYGERGIRVHPPWAARQGSGNVAPGRADFLAYVVTLPGWDNPKLELDRIDNDKDYAPGNLRFIGRRGNMLNRRSVKTLQARIVELEFELELADFRLSLRGTT